MRAAVTRLLPTLALVLPFVTSLPGLAAAQGPFRDLSPASFAALAPRGVAEAPLPRSFRALAVDLGELEDLLALAPAEGSSAALTAPLLVALPYPDGSDRLFRVEESRSSNRSSRRAIQSSGLSRFRARTTRRLAGA